MCPPSAAPCPPSQLNVSVNCAYNSAMLTWNSSPNAVSYTGKAVSTDGHTVMCEAGMNLGCQLTGLQCGKEYTFTVSASDGDCESSDSEPVMDTTGEHAHLLSSYSLLWPILTNPYQRLPIIFYWTSSSPLFFLVLFFPFASSWMDRNKDLFSPHNNLLPMDQISPKTLFDNTKDSFSRCLQHLSAESNYTLQLNAPAQFSNRGGIVSIPNWKSIKISFWFLSSKNKSRIRDSPGFSPTPNMHLRFKCKAIL